MVCGFYVVLVLGVKGYMNCLEKIWEKEIRSWVFIFSFKYEMWLFKSYLYIWSIV